MNRTFYRSKYLSAFVGFLLLSTLNAARASAQSDVLTWHNNPQRTGANRAETLLTPANVNATSFGLLKNVPVDGKVDAQPLYVSALTGIAGGVHNVVFIATEHDTLYAVDADSGSVLWHKTMLGAGETTSDARGCDQVMPEIGITATPVIDRNIGAHGRIFVVAMSKDRSGHYYQRLHSLDVASGAEQAGSPIVVQATYPGTGDNSSNGQVVFDPKQYKDRPALLLSGGNVFTSWSSHCDIRPYTGWIISYSESTLQQKAVLSYTPNGSDAAPWNAGAGPAVDGSGHVYQALGNGTFDTTLNAEGMPSQGDFGNAVIKLDGPTLKPLDYWTMYNTVSESSNDIDLGSGGLMLLPDFVDQLGKTRHLAVAAGKDRNVYVVDTDNLGHFNAAGSSTPYQQLTGGLSGPEFSSPAYFSGRVYYGAVGSGLKSFPVVKALLDSNSVQTASEYFHYPGTTPSISSYVNANGIVWATENSTPVVLHAYDAADLDHELYNSNQAAHGRDLFGAGNKFITPTIANGKVYIASQNSVAIFGMVRRTPAPLADGIYTLVDGGSHLVLDDPNESLESGVALYQATPDGGANQQWFVSYNGNGYYSIQNVKSKLFLGDPNTNKWSGSSAEQLTPSFDDAQLWSLTASGTGYLIKNKSTSLVLGVLNKSLVPGGHVVLWHPDGSETQNWMFK